MSNFNEFLQKLQSFEDTNARLFLSAEQKEVFPEELENEDELFDQWISLIKEFLIASLDLIEQNQFPREKAKAFLEWAELGPYTQVIERHSEVQFQDNISLEPFCYILGYIISNAKDLRLNIENLLQRWWKIPYKIKLNDFDITSQNLTELLQIPPQNSLWQDAGFLNFTKIEDSKTFLKVVKNLQPMDLPDEQFWYILARYEQLTHKSYFTLTKEVVEKEHERLFKKILPPKLIKQLLEGLLARTLCSASNCEKLLKDFFLHYHLMCPKNQKVILDGEIKGLLKQYPQYLKEFETHLKREHEYKLLDELHQFVNFDAYDAEETEEDYIEKSYEEIDHTTQPAESYGKKRNLAEIVIEDITNEFDVELAEEMPEFRELDLTHYISRMLAGKRFTVNNQDFLKLYEDLIRKYASEDLEKFCNLFLSKLKQHLVILEASLLLKSEDYKTILMAKYHQLEDYLKGILAKIEEDREDVPSTEELNEWLKVTSVLRKISKELRGKQ